MKQGFGQMGPSQVCLDWVGVLWDTVVTVSALLRKRADATNLGTVFEANGRKRGF
jgi:hypothetical protein